MQSTGFLGIWSDIAPEEETDYLHWLTREHTAERLGVDGFRAVRVFRAHRADVSRYFILYDLETPTVLGSEAYLARLNRPTAWTRRIMPLIRNFVRGGGTMMTSIGVGQGGTVMPLPLESGQAGDAAGVLSDLARRDRISAVRLYRTDHTGTSIATSEKSMREGDRTFDGLLLIEGLDEASVMAAHDQLRQHAPALRQSPANPAQVYSLAFSLSRGTPA